MLNSQINHGGRPELALGWTVLFFLGSIVAAMLTLGGVHWLLEQRAVAPDFKAELIATILGMGFVFVGPVLLFALAVLSPQWWLHAVKARAKRLVFGSDSP